MQCRVLKHQVQDSGFKTSGSLHEGTRIFMIESTGKDDGPASHTPADSNRKIATQELRFKKERNHITAGNSHDKEQTGTCVLTIIESCFMCEPP